MAKPKINLGTVLIVAVMLVIVLSSSGFQFWNPVRFTFPLTYTGACIDQDGVLFCPTGQTTTTTAATYVSTTTGFTPTGSMTTGTITVGSSITITSNQEWVFFDKSGIQLGSPIRSDAVGFPFQVAPPTFDINKLGFTRLNEHHALENAVPVVNGVGFFLFTTHTVGQILVDGQPFASITLTRWPTPNWLGVVLTNWLIPNMKDEDAAFVSGDIAGTARDGAFYLIWNKAVHPDECTVSPASCVDMSSIVQQGKDVTISASFTETWTEWFFTFNPYQVLAGPCDYRVTLLIPIGPLPLVSQVPVVYCIHSEEKLGPTPVAMKPIPLSSLTSITATTPISNTVFFTTTTTTGANGEPTTITKWGVKYSNTTTMATVTTAPPNSPFGNMTLCDFLPKELQSTCKNGFKLPQLETWQWILIAVVALVILYLLFRRGTVYTQREG